MGYGEFPNDVSHNTRKTCFLRLTTFKELALKGVLDFLLRIIQKRHILKDSLQRN